MICLDLGIGIEIGFIKGHGRHKDREQDSRDYRCLHSGGLRWLVCELIIGALDRLSTPFDGLIAGDSWLIG